MTGTRSHCCFDHLGHQNLKFSSLAVSLGCLELASAREAAGAEQSVTQFWCGLVHMAGKKLDNIFTGTNSCQLAGEPWIGTGDGCLEASVDLVYPGSRVKLCIAAILLSALHSIPPGNFYILSWHQNRENLPMGTFGPLTTLLENVPDFAEFCSCFPGGGGGTDHNKNKKNLTRVFPCYFIQNKKRSLALDTLY